MGVVHRMVFPISQLYSGLIGEDKLLEVLGGDYTLTYNPSNTTVRIYLQSNAIGEPLHVILNYAWITLANNSIFMFACVHLT